MQVYLEREGPDGRQRSTLDSENWGEVAQLLGRKHHIIDPLHALTLVPDEVIILHLPLISHNPSRPDDLERVAIQSCVPRLCRMQILLLGRQILLDGFGWP